MVFHSSRLIFHGFMLDFKVFQGSRLFFMVPTGFSWSFKVTVWFFMVSCRFFLAFFKVPDWFLMVLGEF